MKIKEVCEQTNPTRRAVRFYEEKGLIRPAVTQGNEYRDYSPEDVQLDRTELEAIIHTARDLHVPVTAHAYTPELIKILAELGITR